MFFSGIGAVSSEDSMPAAEAAARKYNLRASLGTGAFTHVQASGTLLFGLLESPADRPGVVFRRLRIYYHMDLFPDGVERRMDFSLLQTEKNMLRIDPASSKSVAGPGRN
jgi:hypothetical protein